MAKEAFNRSAEHKNIGEIVTGNNIGGSVMGFWNKVADSIENEVKDGYSDYTEIDKTPEKITED